MASEKEQLDDMDRSIEKGFHAYWSKRPEHFKELYDMDYNPKLTRKRIMEIIIEGEKK